MPAAADHATIRRLRSRIALSDGTSLAADLRLPVGDGPWPALVTFVPYRADDFLAASFEYHNDQFALAGYAVAVVDFRGTGASDGAPAPAFSEQEGADAVEVIEWAGTQPWSSGDVGMWGVSYGAITSLRAAALRPPRLRAIVAIQGTHDLYQTIYPGGVANFQGAIGAWGGLVTAMQLLPPSDLDGDGEWRRRWAERLRSSEPSVMPWGRHPTLDDFWQPKQIDVEQIEAASFLIGGWRDIFASAVPEAYERIAAPKKLWIGPWMHGSPDFAPTEAIDHLPAMNEWWDVWLRGRPSAITSDPPVSIFVQHRTWRHEHHWPIARTERRTLYPAPAGTLDATPDADESWAPHTGDATVGVTSGLWEPLALGCGGPEDQNEDDRRSLCFTSAPVAEDVEITGRPLADLHVRLLAGDDAVVVVRLCEVTPAGESRHITAGHLRLSHRDGHETPAAVTVGSAYRLGVELTATSYVVAAGSRLRVAVASSLFPQLLPDPTDATLAIGCGGPSASSFTLPTVPDAPTPTAQCAPLPLEQADDRRPLVTTAQPRWSVHVDKVARSVSISSGMTLGFSTADRSETVELDHTATGTVAAGAPDAARLECRTRVRLSGPDRDALVRTEIRVTGEAVEVRGTVDVDGQPFFEHVWTTAAP